MSEACAVNCDACRERDDALTALHADLGAILRRSVSDPFARAVVVRRARELAAISRRHERVPVLRLDIVAAVRAAVVDFVPLAAAKRIAFEVSAGAGVGHIAGDADRVVALVSQLLGNALKFTPEGGTVAVNIARRLLCVDITVKDSGKGIDSAALPRIHHGGLGLTEARRLAHELGGSLSAVSAGADRGSTFRASLPALGADDAKRRRLLEGLSILVVDDAPDVRGLVATILKLKGAVVTAVESAEAALDVLAVTVPDVLVSDIGMPGLDGYDLIRMIRASDRVATKVLPAAALTAYVRSEDRDAALDAGYQVHLGKPIEAHLLVDTVARLAGRPVSSLS